MRHEVLELPRQLFRQCRITNFSTGKKFVNPVLAFFLILTLHQKAPHLRPIPIAKRNSIQHGECRKPNSVLGSAEKNGRTIKGCPARNLSFWRNSCAESC